MRRTLIAGNWKMHKNSETARGFARDFLKLYQTTPDLDVCIAAPFTELLALEGVTGIEISPRCTCCEPDLFWSHRRCGDKTRMLAFIEKRKE